MNEDKYPLTRLEAIKTLINNPDRMLESNEGFRYRIKNGLIEYNDINDLWGLSSNFNMGAPDGGVRYRVLQLPPEPEVLKPVELCREAYCHLWNDVYLHNSTKKALQKVIGLAIAQAIRDARECTHE